MPPHPSPPDLIALQTLRCIGFASPERITAASGLEPGQLLPLLRWLSDRGLVEHQEGPFGGWGISDAGRNTAQSLVMAELDEAGAAPAVTRAYEVFRSLNPAVLDVCGDWQMRKVAGTPVLNDHTDSHYDAMVLSRLMRLDDEAGPVCADLASLLSRFQGYGPRLASALDRAMSGVTTAVADDFDSYHTVWFQLHQDLLTTLGISRDDERRGGALG